MKTKENIAKEVYGQEFEKLCDSRKRIVMTILTIDGKEIDRFSKIPKISFILFKLTSLVLLWLAFFMKIKILVVVSFIIIAISIFFKIKNNPLIFIYSNTLGKIIKWKEEVLDEKAIKFANKGGAALQLICLILLYTYESAGWIALIIVALIKTASTVGFCPGVKIYYCMNNGCCMFKKK